MTASRTFSFFLLSFTCVILTDATSARADDDFQTAVAPFLKQHCYDCHGPDKQQSRIRFDQIQGMKAGNRNLWTMVYERVAAGEMPPPGRPQPTDDAKKQVLTWIREQQRKLGVSGSRRLNRRELSAALQDLTGLDVDFADALPGDGKVAGFDTGAEALQEASDAVARWLQITRRAVDGIRFLEPANDLVLSADLTRSKDTRRTFDAWKEHGASVRGNRGRGLAMLGTGLLLQPRAVGERDKLSIYIPPPPGRQAVLRLTLEVSVMKPFDDLPNPHLWVQVGGKNIDFRELTCSLDKPQTLVYEVHLGDLAVESRGLAISLSNKIEVPYAVEGFNNEDRSNPRKPVPGGTGLFRPKYDRRKTPPEKTPAPFVVLKTIKIEPQFTNHWPPKSWNADLGEINDNLDSAKRLLDLWIERAWRRPVQADEKAPFVKLYQKLRDKGMSFDDALRAAFQSILLSAPFRYQASPAHPDPVVAQHAIASRLSFMLLGGPPDAELRRLAAAGKLHDTNLLDQQVDRLLADPRSRRFIEPFVTQWLEMEQPITIASDDLQKQDFRFARYLKASMKEETLAYIAKLIDDNRPAKKLIVSDWTMMNDILAKHYGYDGVEGGELRKVTLRKNDPRGGGILGHAGIQSMLCWMGENWVIYRGAWALRHILDDPPPPPPLEVPELDPSAGANRGKPFRELLKQHQADARCAVCHKSIDPVGFAFQNFDISGRWRKVEYHHYSHSVLDGRIAWKGVGKTRPVDTKGHLPRGENFKTFAEFKQIVVKNYQHDMVRGILKKLMLYATGRRPGIDGMLEIASIMKTYRRRDFPLRDLIKAVVRSRAFTLKQP